MIPQIVVVLAVIKKRAAWTNHWRAVGLGNLRGAGKVPGVGGITISDD
jgi:hypothetical protein